MDKPSKEKIKFNGLIEFSRWYFVTNYQYRILIETSDTHWRRLGQPASEPVEGDVITDTVLEFFEIQERMGILEVLVVDRLAAILFDNRLGMILNKLRRGKQPYENVGLLLHSNKFVS